MPSYVRSLLSELCAKFGADLAAMRPKISKDAASFHSLRRLCACVKPGGYCSRTKAISEVGALPVFIAAMVFSSLPYAYLSTLPFPPLSASAGCERRLAPPIASLPLRKQTALYLPSPHPVQWLLFYFDAVV